MPRRFVKRSDYWTRERPSRIRRRGEKEPPSYHRWENMKQRCGNPRAPGYKNYGGRGIRVCDRWKGRDGYLNFVADIGEPPTPEHTIDRINNDGDYEPGNVRWATNSQQGHNRRPVPNSSSGHTGVSWSKAVGKWHAYITMERKRIHLGYYSSLMAAVKVRKSAARLLDVHNSQMALLTTSPPKRIL